MDTRFARCGFFPADILLPQGCDMARWSVVACDQYTSQPEYWRQAEDFVGDAPSTLRLMLPEAYLGTPQETGRTEKIRRAMAEYLGRGLFAELLDSMVYVERTLSGGRVRHGLVGALDLEQYDYRPGAGTLIRATEGTVLSRIPPRVRVRQGAPLELPHVMVLIDDPADTVIGPLTRGAGELPPLYDFDLMQGGGHIRGRQVSGDALAPVAAALETLVSPETFAARYGLSGRPVLGYAVGDGNHSLATARRCYEMVKEHLPREEALRHPARYALVELINLHDPALRFEPIHRLLTGVDPEAAAADFLRAVPGARAGEGPGHRVEYVWAGGTGVITFPSSAPLTVAPVQEWVDRFISQAGPEAAVDYIHGDDTARRLGSRPRSLALLLPPMDKNGLFPSVIRDGALPRKTFSMGEADEKRFYLECRRIDGE